MSEPLQNLFQPAAAKAEREQGPKESRKQREAKQPPATEPAKPAARRKRAARPSEIGVFVEVTRLLATLSAGARSRVLDALRDAYRQ